MSTQKTTPAEIRNILAQHNNGSEHLYRHGLMRKYHYTEGVQAMGEFCGAYWLIDAVLSHQMTPRVRAEEFQVWKLMKAATSASWPP